MYPILRPDTCKKKDPTLQQLTQELLVFMWNLGADNETTAIMTLDSGKEVFNLGLNGLRFLFEKTTGNQKQYFREK